jgi:hypothetical protein
MKREELQEIEGRHKASGSIKKFGLCNTGEGKIISILLVDVTLYRDEEIISMDHVWIKINKKIQFTPMRIGDLINFTCLPEIYYFAPLYDIPQGYGIHTIRNVETTEIGAGISLAEFTKEVRDKHQLACWFGEKEEIA